MENCSYEYRSESNTPNRVRGLHVRPFVEKRGRRLRWGDSERVMIKQLLLVLLLMLLLLLLLAIRLTSLLAPLHSCCCYYHLSFRCMNATALLILLLRLPLYFYLYFCSCYSYFPSFAVVAITPATAVLLIVVLRLLPSIFSNTSWSARNSPQKII